jgi:urease accessory protein
MRACARIVAEADGDGRTRASVLRSESPLLLRRTGPRTDARLTVHLVGGAAGPLRGDDLRLDIEVGPGARLDVRSVAASLALPGPPGRPPSRTTVCASVAEGATLRWMPEPLIAGDGCHHMTCTDVWGEPAERSSGGTSWSAVGTAKTRRRVHRHHVRHAGATVYRHELAIGPAAPGWCGPAVLGRGRAVGSAIVVGAAAPPPAAPPPAAPPPAAPPPAAPPPAAPPPAAAAGEDAAIMPLAGTGFVAMAVCTDIRRVRAILDPLRR